MRKLILISKDAVSKDYLPVYGNRFWKTPNIDYLAKKGTVFNRHYTVAASTAMAFYSMITGQYCYETACKDYGDEQPFLGITIFDRFAQTGFNSHLIWDRSFSAFANDHLKIIEGKVNVHDLDIIPKIAPHITGQFDDLSFDEIDSKNALKQVYSILLELSQKEEDSFIWIHLPHVLAGRNSYCSDIDLFDKIVGYGREIFGDDNIFISADHGNMDGKNGKFGYGFDLNESAICIPLITPKINGLDQIDYVTCNLDLFDILNKRIEKKELVISDTAYYCQPKRKIALVTERFKLVYSKRDKHFELYDLLWDPIEKYNLFYPEFFDTDRNSWYSLNQRFFYPYWEEAFTAKEELLEYFSTVWRTGSFVIENKNLVKFRLKYFYSSLVKKKRKENIKNIGK